MEILPGIGMGPIKYGINEPELISILGKPDRIDEQEYVEGTGDWYRELWYSPQNLEFTFNQEDDFRLGLITVSGAGYPLLGKDLFGLSLAQVREFIINATQEAPTFKDHTYLPDETHHCLEHDGLGILFWFDADQLSEMQCSYLFENDNETIIWP